MVLGVNTVDDRKIALDYLKQNQVTFPNVLDSSAAANRAMMEYETLRGMSAVPMTYLIGRDGKVVEAESIVLQRGPQVMVWLRDLVRLSRGPSRKGAEETGLLTVKRLRACLGMAR